MAINDPFIGQQIGNYRILTRINSGSFGSVYQGKHIIFEDEPIVAIKILHASLASQQERNDFVKEAQLLKKLQHPNILRILDAGFHNGLPYLVTEYASGGSLRDRLNQYNNRPLSIDEAVTMLRQIGEGLSYAHQQRIVHRDLKPENILFNTNGEALLADFGIAVILATARTGMMGLGGTPPYMAPEQFEGLVSTKSDQYALGCIAYELVTGHRLFAVPHPTLEAFWYHHAKVEPVPPTRYNPVIPKHIEQAILTALAKDRVNRYSDIPTFIHALIKTEKQWVEEGDKHPLIKTEKQWVEEGNKLANSKRYEEALTAYEQAIHLDPDYVQAHMGKGATLYDLKRYEEAIAAYEQVIRLDPNFAAAYYNKGNALNNLKRYEEALTAYDHAIRLDPNFAVVYIGKGNALNNLKRYEEALTAYEQLIRLDPNFAAAYIGKGYALNNLKRYEEALTAFEHAIHLNPNYALAYNNKGYALNDLKRYEEALTAFEHAIRLDPNYAFAYSNKGNALNNLKRYKEALTAYDHAIRLDPNFAVVYYNKGLVLEMLSKSREAQEAKARAKQLGYEG